MPTIQITGAFESLDGLDGQFIILDTPGDSEGSGSGGAAMPGPPAVWNSAPPASNYDWSFFTVAVDGAGQVRYSGRGATLISPSYAVCAHHARGSGAGFHFLQPDGVEISRTSTMTDGVDYWRVEDPGDLGLIKFNAPITTIAPIPVLLDCSVASNMACVAIELDRHLNRMFVRPGLTNANSNWTVSRYDAGDAIEGGDSGKPAVCVVYGTPVLIITAFESASSVGDVRNGHGPSASGWISDLNAILAADDEELTLWDVTPNSQRIGPPMSASHSPASPTLAILGA